MRRRRVSHGYFLLNTVSTGMLSSTIVKGFMKNIGFGLFYCILGLSGCAKQGFPPGGPEDNVAPEIIDTWPPQNSTEVDLDTDIRLVFSESMNRESVEKAVFFSPKPSEQPRFSWKRNTLIIQYRKSLAKNTTYIVKVGTKATDLRRNTMTDSYGLVFSTGAVIENRRIKGRLAMHSSKISGVDIWVYPMLSGQMIDPTQMTASFNSQTSNDGGYYVEGLSRGSYRLFAADDRDHDSLLDPGEESYGIPPWDIKITDADSVVEMGEIVVIKRDTSSISLFSVKGLSSRAFDIYFDRPFVLSTLKITVSNPDLHLETLYQVPGNERRVIVRTEPMKRETEYTLNISKVEDKWGNGFYMNQTEVPTFHVPEKPSKTDVQIKETTPRFVTDPVDTVRVIFSDGLFIRNQVENIEPEELFKSEASLTGLKVIFEDPVTLILTRISGWEMGSHYSYIINNDLLENVHGNSLTDSVRTVGFYSVPIDTLGSLEGRLSVVRNETGNIRLIFTNQEMEDVSKQWIMDEPGEFSVDRILPGHYLLSVYRDTNGNGRYDHGSLFPFNFGEHWFSRPDTIIIRERWTTKINVKF